MCRFIEPTILVDPPLESEIMTEEIFGPLLPIISVNIAAFRLTNFSSSTGQGFWMVIFFPCMDSWRRLKKAWSS